MDHGLHSQNSGSSKVRIDVLVEDEAFEIFF